MITSFFAIYFAIQKFGNKVSAQYTVSMDLYTSEHISNIVLSNKKDKTLNIWSVHALFEKEYQLELDKFDPPLILKPYESVSVSLPKYSSASIGSDVFNPDFMSPHLEIYADIGDKLLKCSQHSKKDQLKNFKHISKQNTQFNGHIYNDRVSYILSYYYEETLHTAFICRGLITNEWSFSPNHLGNKEFTAKEIEYFLVQYGFDELFANYHCYEVNYPRTKLVFFK